MRRLIPVLPVLIAVSCQAAPPPAPRGPAAAEHVLIISVDGLRPDAIDAAGALNLQALIRRGTYCPKAETVRPSVTLPSHTSMLTGLDFPRHGVVWNNFRPGHIGHSTVFSVAAGAGLSTAMFFSKEKFHYLADPRWVHCIYGTPFPKLPEPIEDFTDPAWLDEYDAKQAAYEARRPYSPLRPRLWLAPPRPFGYVLDVKTAADALAKAFEERWPGPAYALTFLHFREPDEAGHRFGWMSKEYLDAVLKTDAALGRVFGAVSRAGRLEKTAILVSADHGGTKGRRDHFKRAEPDRPENVTIPWICAGPGVPSGRVLDRVVRTYDTAPTALAFLGLPAPAGIDGVAVAEVLPKVPAGSGR
jgi:predicted AlkP superfamily pyrophosphatase or phosphodiesterase